MHQYCKEHNPDIYDQDRSYYEEHITYNMETLKYEATCYRCPKKLNSCRKLGVFRSILRHIHATKYHNPEEYKKTEVVVKAYIEQHPK